MDDTPLMILCPICRAAVEVVERLTDDSPPMLYEGHARADRCFASKKHGLVPTMCESSWQPVPFGHLEEHRC
jgi:hypothetical protein